MSRNWWKVWKSTSIAGGGSRLDESLSYDWGEEDVYDWAPLENETGAPADALRFIYDALQYTPQYLGKEPGDVMDRGEHNSAANFCKALLLYARDCYGRTYVEVLRAWGLRSSEDVGRVVYGLVRRGYLETSDQDHQTDFDNLFLLNGDGSVWPAFQQEYGKIPAKDANTRE